MWFTNQQKRCKVCWCRVCLESKFSSLQSVIFYWCDIPTDKSLALQIQLPQPLLSHLSFGLTQRPQKVGQDKIYLPKVGKTKIIWSRLLPNPPSSVTIIKDSAGRYFASFIVDINPDSLPEDVKVF